MTTGDYRSQIIKFMIPLAGSNLLQQLYTVVDGVIVGKGVGVEALAAVGATDWIYWLLLWFAGGAGQGFSMSVAEAFGEKNERKLIRAINLSILLSIIMGILVSGLGIAFSGPALRLIGTPEGIYDQAHLYISIMYIGVGVISVYNTIACDLRAIGDSRNPFVALLIATVLNVFVDMLFVLVFHWGVAGAAAASVLAQITAGVYCYIVLKRTGFMNFDSQYREWDRNMIVDLSKRGTITGFQYSIVAISGIIVQSGINHFGVVYVAGFSATTKLYGVLEAISLAMGGALMVYVSQNLGARNKERIVKGEKFSLTFGIIVYVSFSLIGILFGKPMLKIFIDSASVYAAEVLTIAYRYLFNLCVCMVCLYIINTYRYIILAMNKMKIIIGASLTECAVRIVLTLFAVYVIGASGLFYIEAAAWVSVAIMLYASYRSLIKKLEL